MAFSRFSAALLCVAATSVLAQGMRPVDVDKLPESPPTTVDKYGKGDLQYGELRLPAGKGPFPIAVVIHGGCRTKGFATLRNTSPVATALAAKGVATWNIEYRQVGDAGGGWPGTFLDWGAAVDHLRVLSQKYPIDLARVAVVGHSAGAHAALWAGGRGHLPKESEITAAEPLPVQAVFAIDGPVDLASLVGPDAGICGKPVIAPLMGGTPSEKPERYAHASPQKMLPLGPRQFLIGSALLTPAMAQAYSKIAKAKGDRVQFLSIDTGHFEVIAPGRDEWNSVEGLIVSNMLSPDRKNVK